MANLRVDLNYPIQDGMTVTFKAACDCTAIEGLIIYYPAASESALSTASKTFVFKDAHGNVLTGLGNLFSKDSYVKVTLDTVNNFAYIQNADTNSYLEGNFSKVSHKKNVTLLASSWSNKRYTLADEFITSTNIIELLPRENNGITYDQLMELGNAMIIGGTQSTGSLELVAMGTTPSNDIPITIIIRGDL